VPKVHSSRKEDHTVLREKKKRVVRDVARRHPRGGRGEKRLSSQPKEVPQTSRSGKGREGGSSRGVKGTGKGVDTRMPSRK